MFTSGSAYDRPTLTRGTTLRPALEAAYDHVMCRSIKTLRPPFTDEVTEEDVHAAALQYVRKISGFRAPAAHNTEAFSRAVDAVGAATADLLEKLQVRRPASSRREAASRH